MNDGVSILPEESAKTTWTSIPIDHFFSEAARLEACLSLSTAGVGFILSSERPISTIIKFNKDLYDEGIFDLRNAENIIKIAEDENNSGHQFFHSWAILGLWTILESTIRNLIEEWIRSIPETLSSPRFDRIKFSLGEYERTPIGERPAFIVNLIEREYSSARRDAITKFEDMLDYINISGPIPKKIRVGLYEFNKTRNLIVHNHGIVDEQFSVSCPWIEAPIGTKITINERLFQKYYTFSWHYMTILMCRVLEHFGNDVSDLRSDVDVAIEQLPD